MGKAGNGATDAKKQARARRIEMETDWQQRDDRIDEATAAVIVALAEIASARDLVWMSNGSAGPDTRATVAQIHLTVEIAVHEMALHRAN